MPEAEARGENAASLDADLALLCEASAEAGRIALGYFGKSPQVWDKADNAGPVTEGDLAVDAYLREVLSAARPGVGWLSEETPDDPARMSQREVFVLDPIDGTRNFIAGEPDWAISLALVRDGLPVAGVVRLPARGLCFTARAGGMAHLNGVPIHASHCAQLDQARVLAARKMLAQQWLAGKLPFKPEFRPSLAYRLALVAEGRFDAMLKLGLTYEWDIAAGVLIAAEAGARVTLPDGTAPRFNTQNRYLDGIVAAAPRLYGPLLQALTPDGGAEPVQSV